MSDLPLDLVAAPGRLLTVQEAAAYLGVSTQTFQSSRLNGRYDIPEVHIIGRNRRHYRIEDLDNFILSRVSHHRVWANYKALPVDRDGLPFALIAKLIGATPAATKKYLQTPGNRHTPRYRIKDRTLPAVVEYMRYQWERDYGLKIRNEYRKEVKALKHKVRQLTRKLEARS
jgi:hypothetical protein